ncbi:SidA/IucD/PvdA family monooxygenase [Sharpea azabuensis]|uniref:SidA/IucD/PvdA family monooxygenase n=1 Tax=Sharpea porci TaxID=2652286 RepID=A0A844FVC2_9FIRM|nr:FAD-dependent oxidoreductase [Sharpea porci]MST89593.1 SidA/IucD/PvdA family monooxygenase [Sharpea porci]
MITDYDVLIAGFGKAGKTIAAKLAAAGRKVALIEKDPGMYGGTCINVGCIPSKRLIEDAMHAPDGLLEEKAEYYRRAIAEKRILTAALRKANYDKLIAAGVSVIDGTASFEDAFHLAVDTAEGRILLQGKQIIINTGSVPVIPPIPGADQSRYVHVSETLMDLETLPEHLIIVGGGYIGLEFASMYREFGSSVTVLQDQKEFLPKEDEDLAASIRSVLERKGVRIITGARISGIQENVLAYEADGKSETLQADAILLATGRRPNTADLHCERAGIALNARGGIETDEHLRTAQRHIWAAGDVLGKLQFTYLSLDDSRIILDDMNGSGTRTIENRGAFSYSVFLDPPFSRVGLNEKEAQREGIGYRTVSLPASSVPKAKVLRKQEGMLKALITEDGTILGAELFCAESPEMINLVKLAMDQNLKADVLKNFIFTHPTMSESLNDLFSL